MRVSAKGSLRQVVAQVDDDRLDLALSRYQQNLLDDGFVRQAVTDAIVDQYPTNRRRGATTYGEVDGQQAEQTP